MNANLNHFRRNSDNGATVSDAGSQPASRFQTEATNNDHARNAVGNINFKHRFYSTGRELTADIDYGTYHSSSLTPTASAFYNSTAPRTTIYSTATRTQEAQPLAFSFCF